MPMANAICPKLIRGVWRFGLILLTPWSATPLLAQNIAGTWQGTLTAFGRSFREVVEVTRADSGWGATIYSIDWGSDGVPSNSVALQGSHVTMAFPLTALTPTGASYDGQLDASGRTMTGTWVQP